MLNFLKSYCDYVYIPETVIKELNFQKDRGTEAKRKLASLCLNKITELKSDKFIIANDQACKGENHDDKIFAYVKLLASSNRNDMVYLLSNDKDFKLKNSDGLTNLLFTAPIYMKGLSAWLRAFRPRANSFKSSAWQKQQKSTRKGYFFVGARDRT